MPHNTGGTGADRYLIHRLTRAQTYLDTSLTSHPDIVFGLATAPTSWDEMDDQIRGLGSEPGYGLGVGDLLDHLIDQNPQDIPAPDVAGIKRFLADEGYVLPDTRIDGIWRPGDEFAQGLRVWEDDAFQARRRAEKVGGTSIQQWLGYISNVLPSRVWQALAGTARNIATGMKGTAQRLQIGVSAFPEALAARFQGQDEFEAIQERIREEQKRVTGYHADERWLDDFINIASVVPIARGAGTIGQGARASRATAAARGGWLAGVQGAQAPGLVSAVARRGLAKAAERDLMGSVVGFASKPYSLRSLAQGFLTRADQLAYLRSTAAGQFTGSVIKGTLRTALSERALGTLGSGVVFPNVKLGQADKSSLSRAIDDSPALGHATSWGPFGEGRALGNPVDLTALLWYPQTPLKLSIGQVKNALGRHVPVNETAPLTRLTGMSREQLADALGGEANLAHSMRYWKLQSQVFKQTTERLRAKGITPNQESWERQFRLTRQKVEAELKAEPGKVEQAIATASHDDLVDTFRYIFADYPELLARRGQGGASLGNWYKAQRELGGTDAAGVRVVPFQRAGSKWSDANREALEAAYDEIVGPVSVPPVRREGVVLEPTRVGQGKVATGQMALHDRMARRIGQRISSETVLGFRRMDNELGSAQQLGAWTSLYRRLYRARDALQDSYQGGKPIVPRNTYRADLRAMGLTDQEISALLPAHRINLVGAPLDEPTAQRLLGSLNTRLSELRDRASRYYPETVSLDDKAITRHMEKIFYGAARDVNLADDALQGKLASLGYQPVALAPGSLSLRDVDLGNVADTLGEAGQLANVMEFLGLARYPITRKEIAGLRTNALQNELAQVAGANGLPATGKGMLDQLWDVGHTVSQGRSEVRVPWGRRPLIWKSPELHDLRQLSIRDLEANTGWTTDVAQQVHDAIRRGAAFGFDAAHPLQTSRQLAQAFRIEGLPGVEDALRTLGSLRGRLPRVVQGPAGALLNLPDRLARMRDWVQFSLSPLFAVGNVVEAKIIRQTSKLPFHINAGRRIEELAGQSADRTRFMDDFWTNYEDVVGGRARALASFHDANRELGGFGFFGWSNRHSEALDAWYLRQRGMPVDDVRRELDRIYRYIDRSPLQKSANYVLFPLSFNLKMATTLTNWMIQSPARILAVTTGLKYYDATIDKDDQVTEWVKRYLPLLGQINRINFFAQGFSVGLSPIGGRNRALWNMGKQITGIVSEDPRLGAFLPIGYSDDDALNALDLILQAIPFYRQGRDLLHKGIMNQFRVIGGALDPDRPAGSEEWQVDNYFDDMRELRRQVAIQLGNNGLRPSFSTLTDPFGNPNPSVSPEFFSLVQAEMGAIEAKYPAGAKLARTLPDTERAEELQEMARKPYKTRAEASILYLEAAKINEEEKAKARGRFDSVGRAGQAMRYRQIAGAMVAGDIPPSLPGDLDEDQIRVLRGLATSMGGNDPEFLRLYDRLFEWDLGPLELRAPAPGV